MSQLVEQSRPLSPDIKAKRLQLLTDAYQTAQDEMLADPRHRAERLFDGDGFEQLTINELFQLGLKVLEAPSQKAAYTLMAQRANRGAGDNYYDLLVGPEHKNIYSYFEQILTDKRMEPNTVAHAVDIASGTGMSAKGLALIAKRITLVDVVPELLHIGKRRTEKVARRTNAVVREVVSDATDLPFEPESVDIIVESGFIIYLTAEEREAHYRDLHRVLKPGGRYYFSYAGSARKIYENSPRARLADQVVSALFEHSWVREIDSHYETINYPPGLFTQTKVTDSKGNPIGIARWDKLPSA